MMYKRSQNRPFVKTRIAACLGALAVVVGSAQILLADAVKLDGAWIDKITVLRIEDGMITYMVRGTEQSDPVGKIEGLRLDNYPDLAEAQKLLADGKANEAVTLLRRMIGTNPRQVWARQYAERVLVQAQDAANRPTEALLTYLKLANEKAPAEYLKSPPVTSIAKASDAVKKDIRDRLTAAMPRLQGEAKTGAEAMLALVKAEEPAAKPADAAPTSGAVATPAATATPTPAASTPAAASGASSPIPGMPKDIPQGVEGVKLFKEGKYEEMLKWADDQLKVAQTNFSILFYLRGMALFALAEKSRNQDMYKDAGVSFMKSAVYFPRDSYAGPSYLETARVYVRLGKFKTASKLLNKATERIFEDPGLEAKIEQVQKAIENESTTE